MSPNKSQYFLAFSWLASAEAGWSSQLPLPKLIFSGLSAAARDLPLIPGAASLVAQFKLHRRRNPASQVWAAVRDLPALHRSWGQLLLSVTHSSQGQLLLWHDLNCVAGEAKPVRGSGWLFFNWYFLVRVSGAWKKWHFWKTPYSNTTLDFFKKIFFFWVQ